MTNVSELNMAGAADLPMQIRFGTSSWNYPGWKGLVYHRSYSSKKDFEARCLEEYGGVPWFRTVGLDSSFYGPPRDSTLARYASQLPDRIQWVSKVWERITIPRFARHSRYGELAGRVNPYYLDPVLFRDVFLAAYDRPSIREKTGPFVFQFQKQGRRQEDVDGFIDKLDTFLAGLPRSFRYATEIRTRELLCTDYFAVLNKHGATHCFNHWTDMPPLVEQMRAAAASGGLKANFYVSRLLTPLGLAYADAVARFSPYDRLQQEQPAMRRDVLRLARRAVERDAEAFILVNNRLEGNSPRSIEAMGRMIIDA